MGTANCQLHSASCSKGFTLIELLVVIAIIGVLSALVLGSLNSARSKGVDASVKAAMTATRSQSELFFDANGNRYVVTAGSATDICSATGLVNNVKGIYESVLSGAKATGLNSVNTNLNTTGTLAIATCHALANGTAWGAEAPLKGNTAMWCVDSTGFGGRTAASTLASGDARCN
jgi:prepilin-type N-terminal cleavage/methylation domain-containing protein